MIFLHSLVWILIRLNYRFYTYPWYLLIWKLKVPVIRFKIHQSLSNWWSKHILVTYFSNLLTTHQSEYGTERAQLEEKIVQLEHELEEATSNGLEMHKMLSEMLSSQNDTSTFQVWKYFLMFPEVFLFVLGTQIRKYWLALVTHRKDCQKENIYQSALLNHFNYFHILINIHCIASWSFHPFSFWVASHSLCCLHTSAFSSCMLAISFSKAFLNFTTY